MSDIGDSRVEDILEAGIEGEPYEGRPQSRVEELLKELIESGGGTVPIDPSESEIESYPDGKTWIKDIGDGFYIFYVKINGILCQIAEIDSFAPYKLVFSSDGNFTLSVASPQWDGTIEYSIDNGKTWNTWDGSELSGTSSQPIYLRGTGNTVIAKNKAWTFTGKYCTGNIETLLDYRTVANGRHPTMADFCYSYMFSGCTSLTTAPELPATALAIYCYFYMFSECTSLITVPELPATILAANCYVSMFSGCISLKLSDVQTEEYHHAYRIPTLGTGTAENRALNGMFANTGGTFTGTPTINTTYYTDHEPIG